MEILKAEHLCKIYGEGENKVTALDDVSAAPDLESYAALGLVDFYPLPHYRNEPFAEAVEQVLKEHGDALDLRPFSNNQAIALSGGHAELQTSGD